MRVHCAGGRGQYSGDDLQQGAFATAVQADDAHRLATVQGKADAMQGFMHMQAFLRGLLQAARQCRCDGGQAAAAAMQGRGDQPLRR